jgi:O-antigen/teichoic acid export membrane protein
VLKILLKDVAIYGSANAFSKVFGIILIPLYISYLSKTEYGTLDGLLIFASFLLPTIIFGQDSSIARYYLEVKDPHERRKMVTESFVCQFCIGLVLTAVTLIASSWIAEVYFNKNDIEDYIRLAVLSIFANWLVQFCANLLKWTFQRWKYILLTTIGPLVVMLITILLFRLTAYRIEGVLIAQIIGYSFFGFLGMWFIRKELTLIRRFKWLPSLLAFGWPYWLIMLLPTLLPSFDRYMVMNHISHESLAIYALAFRLASLIQLPIFGFQTAWGPYVYSTHADGANPAIYNSVLKGYVILLLLFGLLVKIFENKLVLLFSDSSYLTAAPLIAVILLAFLVESISWITGIGIDLSKKTWLSAVAYGMSTLLGGLITWFLVLEFELWGLVFGGLISKGIYTIIKSVMAQKVHPLPFDLGKVVFFVILGATMLLSFNELVSADIWTRLLYALVLVIVLLVAARYMLFNEAERYKLLLTWRALIKR